MSCDPLRSIGRINSALQFFVPLRFILMDAARNIGLPFDFAMPQG